MSQQDANASIAAAPRRLERIFASDKVNRQSNLSIPGAVFYDMIKNPKFPEVVNKLNQICKYPFSKHKIIPVKSMVVYENNCAIATIPKEGRLRRKNMDLENMSLKMWLCGHLFLHDSEINLNLLLTRLYRSDIKSLWLWSNIQSNVYQQLVASGSLKHLHLASQIENADGSAASLDEILVPLSKLQYLEWDFDENASIKTVEDVEQFAHILGKLAKLERLDLVSIPDQLFGTFVDFFKKNKSLEIRIGIYDLAETRKEMLENFMEEMIKEPFEKLPEIHGELNNLDPDVLEKYIELVPGL